MQGHPGCNNEGYSQGDEHTHACINGNRTHVGAHKPRHESHRKKRRNDRKRSEDGWAAHLINSGWNNFCERLVRKELLMPMDIFNDHNGIIHQNANGEDKCK